MLLGKRGLESRFSNLFYTTVMTLKFFQTLKRRKESADQKAEGKVSLDDIAIDFAEKQKENRAQHERVDDAIRRGTRITKRRIPL